MAQRFRVGLPEIPPNTLVGVRSDTAKSEPPYAVTSAEVAEILAAGAIIEQATAFTFDRTLHNRLMILSTAATAITVTLPSTALVGDSVSLTQKGAGQVTIAAGAGAAIHNAGGAYKTYAQWAVISAFVESNSNGTSASWVVTGDLVV